MSNLDLELKWHNERHDKPKPYKQIIVQTTDGLCLKGYVEEPNRFHPEDISILSTIARVRVKRWRYVSYIN